VTTLNSHLLISQVHAVADGHTGGNPVVEALLRWRPSIMFPNADLNQDAGIVLGAKYLVLASSSFSKGLALMAPNLKTVYSTRLRDPMEGTDYFAPLGGARSGTRISSSGNNPLVGSTDERVCAGSHDKAGGMFKCGGGNGWPQSRGQPDVSVVEVMLPGYNVSQYSGNIHYPWVEEQLLHYTGGGAVCSVRWPAAPH
jgi:hypothetical protein